MPSTPLRGPVLDLALLFAAGLLAGAMNAMAGGGTFASFPALLAVGLPPTVANATSNTALLPGAMVSAWTYRHALQRFGPLSLRQLFAITMLGAIVGAVLLHLTTEATFREILPWLLLVASLALSFAGPIRQRLERTDWELGAGGAIGLQFVIGIYGGYFGGAVSLVMMASWVLVTHLSVKELAPVRTLLLVAANAAACAIFVIFGLISWLHVVPVAAGAVGGGWLGAHLGMRLPAAWVRGVVLAICYGVTAAFFWRG